MEVTRKNFKETLPLVAESIRKSDFLVIDAEFTGLMKGRDVSVFDNPEAYYNTVLNGASEFLLIQFGLCAFYWDDEMKNYKNDAYNFYLFPRGRPERMFLCQSSSLDFLASQGFDFNKLIREGISYLTEPAEIKAREILSEKQKTFNTSNEQAHIKIPDENKQQIDDICKRVRQFLDDQKSDEMEIDRCNAFIRRLLFQELGSRFKNEAFLETKVLENQSRVLKVTRITSEEEKQTLDNQKYEKEWDDFEESVGFSKVAKWISQSEKLVIGHNMLLDLMHTLNHFFQPLPSDYSEFKDFAHYIFPYLLDTKYMSSLPPFKEKVNSSVLPHLLATLSEPPFSLPKAESEEGRGYRQTDDKQHEAGYDAYVTGLCFLAMHAHLSRMRGEPQARASSHSAALKPFLNKVFLARTAYQDSPYMNFAGSDPSPPRDHVFHLTFPKEWSRNDINQLFSPYCPINMQFIDDTTAFVALTRREQARDVIRGLSFNGRVTLIPYARYNRNAKAIKDQEEPRRDFSAIQSARTPENSPRRKLVITKERPEKVEQIVRADSNDRIERGERVERERVDRERVERGEQLERERLDSGERVERGKRIERGELLERGKRLERERLDSGERVERGKRLERERLDSGEQVERGELVEWKERADRVRSKSVSESPSTPAKTTLPVRKRTSSGVFQVDEAEPPPKKIEFVKSNSDITRKKSEKVTNGRRRNIESDDTGEETKGKTGKKEKKDKVIEKFDHEAKSKCVTAFKESDSWD